MLMSNQKVEGAGAYLALQRCACASQDGSVAHSLGTPRFSHGRECKSKK